MKMKILYTFSLFVIVGLIAFSGGPAATMQQDRTGSPVAVGVCQNCHQNGSFNPQVNISVMEDGAAVTAYTPGETYMVRVEVVANNGSPAEYGAQLVALFDNTSNAGAFGTAPSGFQTSPLNSRTYIEHSAGLNEGLLEVEWTAPAAGEGDVIFYAGGTAANDDGGTAGDNGAVNSLTVTEAPNNNTETLEGLSMQMQIMPNPVADQLNVAVTSKNNGDFTLRLTDAFGKVTMEMPMELIAGENQQSVDVSDLAKGMYILQLSGNDQMTTQQMIKL